MGTTKKGPATSAAKPSPSPPTGVAKKASKSAAAPAVAAEQQQQTKATAGSKKKGADEIDAIFGVGKAAKAEPADKQAAGDDDAIPEELKALAEKIRKAREEAKKKKGGAEAEAGTKKATKVEGSKDDLFGAEGGSKRKRTEEGFAIYSEEELGLHKQGGDTPLCPFDCDCCY